MSDPPVQIAVYISGHGYGHLTRTLNLLSLLSQTQKYNFHIRTSSPLHTPPLPYALHPSIIQTSPYQLSGPQSLHSLQTFSSSPAAEQETHFLTTHHIRAVLSDAPALPCRLAHSLRIPAILITNFTFDSIFQALLDATPPTAKDDPSALQQKIDDMSAQYALAHTVIRLPGHIPFPFSGPRIIDAPMHFRAAKRSRTATFASLGLASVLSGKKVLLHCFGGHAVSAPLSVPALPDNWVCLSQTIAQPPRFHRIPPDAYMPDLVGACDVVLGKLGWGMCSEVMGNGYRPFVYVPRSAFVEEAGLLRWMQSKHRRVVRLEVRRYEDSDWVGAIEEAQAMGERGGEFQQEDWAKNEVELVRIFGETIESALG